MLLAGDECRRTQQGNNNAYCQDNEVSWFDWSLVEDNADLVRFVSEIVRFRISNPTLRRRTFLEGGTAVDGSLPDVEWFSPDGAHVDWYAADASLTCFFGAPIRVRLAGEESIEGTPRHVLIFSNAGSLPRLFQFPRPIPIRDLDWRLFIHTGQAPPEDVFESSCGPHLDPSEPIELPERSLVCLVADAEPRRIALQSF